ncbi:hypothetical protein KVR01_012965 [Diaporthe batatas]|uniref:uncharacterized protein n=1 Tax=Diaporthe batatas TaxID=748121 RepID=UPI001D0391A6|nr:uncharacterized protein KVR01_012965 [Diaporthe batatas]KAG8157257.1 hypothetical protein KVR01_012965 [Diaporthe batatas]
MDSFDHSYTLPPTPPRASSQGRRNASPVWWKLSCENSQSTSRTGECPEDRPSTQYTTPQKMTQQSQPPVQFEAPGPVDPADTTEHDPAKSGSRLRRRPAVVALSKQYLQSDNCTTVEHHETYTAQRQTILPPVSAQASRNWAKYRASRRFPLSTGTTDQPAKNKIYSGSRWPSAQTEGTTSEACLSDDDVDSTGQRYGHQTNFTIRSGAEGTWARPPIASEDTASVRVVGGVTAHTRIVQHSETPELPPQRAEFLNAHSSGARYESPLLPSRRDLSSAQDHAGEERRPRGIQPSTAGLDNMLSVSAIPKHQIRGQAAMRVETSPRREWSGHGDGLVKLAATGHGDDQSNPKKGLLDADNMLSQRPEASARVPRQDSGAIELPRLSQKLPFVPGLPADPRPRGGFVLGRAQAVRMSKPGEARLVKLPAKQPSPFNINCLSSEEADLMASMGAVARSSRNNSAWADDDKCGERGSSNIDATAETLLPKQGLRPSGNPRVMPRGKAGAACSSKQPVDEDSGDGHEDGMFHQRVQRLKTNGHMASRDVRHPPSQEKPRNGGNQRGVTEEQSEMPSNLNSPPSGIPGNENPDPRDSGCPSLISDDGRESTSSPRDMAYELARAQIFQEPHGISGWETDETASTVAPHEALSKSSLDLFDISTDEKELVSGADSSEEDDNDETASGGNGGGRWHREPQAPTSPFSHHHDNDLLQSHLQERFPGGSTPVIQAYELGLYARCALLRWMHSTADAPGSPGMHDESGLWWELLRLEDSYRLRYSDETRAEKARPDLSPDVRAFLRGVFPPSDA